MKKAAIFFIFGIALSLVSFKTNDTEQKYKFEFSQQEVQLIFTAIDNSSLPHDKVKEIESIIQQQYTSQLPKDSTKKK